MKILLTILCLSLFSTDAAAIDLGIGLLQKQEPWQNRLEAKVNEVSKSFSGTFGVYVENLKTEKSFKHRAEQRFYIASVIKVFVMVEIFRLVETGRLNWNDTVKVTRSKYRDGAGRVNWMKSGERITIRRLTDLMMMYSDNAATDILIDIAGLRTIENATIKLGLYDLGPLTSLLEVRRSVFRELEPLGGNLTANQFIELWKEKNFERKLRMFAKLVGKPEKTYSSAALKRAYETFYEHGNNSVSLVTLSSLFRKLARGEIISPQVSGSMVNLLKRCHSGGGRIKAGLPKGYTLAHKTGTQYKRQCDAGIIYSKNEAEWLIAICTEKFNSRKEGDALMAEITRALFNEKELNKTKPVAALNSSPPSRRLASRRNLNW